MASPKNSLKRIQFFSKFVIFLVSLSLLIFLSLLGNKFLDDMDQLFEAPKHDAFIDLAAIKAADAKIQEIQHKVDHVETQLYSLEKSYRSSNRAYASAKELFQNWISTRNATQASSENQEVIARAKKLDILKAESIKWSQKYETVNYDYQLVLKEKKQAIAKKDKINEEGDKLYHNAYKAYSIKIFLVRLAFVLPLLILAIFLFIRFRKSKYGALIWAFFFFGLYFFFFGLVPYLPSFGGYIRYIVGVILSVLFGYYLIKQLIKFTEKRKKELEMNQADRVKKINYEAAQKFYKIHACPSCEQNFFIHKWHPLNPALLNQTFFTIEEAPDFCPHCGLHLFGPCEFCQTRNFIPFSFCVKCGKPIEKA